MVEVVSQDGRSIVQQARDLLVALTVLDDLGEQVGVIPAAGLDELLLLGSALHSTTPNQHLALQELSPAGARRRGEGGLGATGRGRDPTNLRLVSCHVRNARSNAVLGKSQGLMGHVAPGPYIGALGSFTRAQERIFFLLSGWKGSFGLLFGLPRGGVWQ